MYLIYFVVRLFYAEEKNIALRSVISKEYIAFICINNIEILKYFVVIYFLYKIVRKEMVIDSLAFSKLGIVQSLGNPRGTVMLD